MDVITDPDTYETSETVEKSSKSGIFSNKRLLVIKNGFLYYCTNVPKNYKGHSPNVLDTLKQLPKFSIQIKSIKQIKMESSNSANLIIKFYEKDMIQREDIRKSISDKNWRYTRKQTKQLDEWKFTFATVLKCRLWYTALLKLNNHFIKQDDKITQFFSAFDPQKRNSQLPPELKNIFKPQQSNKQRTKTQFILKNPANKQSIQIPKRPPSQIILPSQESSPTQKSSPKSQKSPELPFNKKKLQQQKSDKSSQSPSKKSVHQLETIKQQQQNAMRGSDSQPNFIKKPNSTSINSNSSVQLQAKKSQKSMKQKASEMIVSGMQSELKQKKQKIEYLQSILKSKQKQLEDKESELKRVKQQKHRQQEAQNLQSSIQLHEFSVQTDEQEQYQNYYPNSLKKKTEYQSFLQDFNSTQRDTHNFYRNTGSLSLELEQEQKTYENYDFYTQLSKIYTKNGFEQYIKKQIKLINYVDKMKEVAEEAVKDYIDNNSIQKSVEFQSTLFYMKIVCSPGKIVNIQGKQKLVFSNKEHQNLKREFKVYNMLQDSIIKICKKRPNYPIRVPLSFHFQYRGYSALLKYLPYLKQIDQQDLAGIKKTAAKVVGQDHLQNFQFSFIANRNMNLYMLDLRHPYKITSQSAALELSSRNLYAPDFIVKYRSKFLSSNTNQLQSELEKIKNINATNVKQIKQKNQKMMALNQAIFCRYLKNLYRSTEPYVVQSDQQKENTDSNTIASTFLQGFLTTPEEIRDLISESSHIILNGLLVSYIYQLFGFELPSDFDVNSKEFQSYNVTVAPVSRSFVLNSLSSNRLLLNFQDYIDSQKYKLVDSAIDVMQQIKKKNPQSQPRLQYLIIKYNIKKNRDKTQIIKHSLIQLQNLINSIDKHNALKFQCEMLLIQCLSILGFYQKCLQQIFSLINYIEYMLGQQFSGGQVQDCLYLLSAETLAKMGQHSKSMEIYRKLLKNEQKCISEEQIYLSFAQTFSILKGIHPTEIIDFLLSCQAGKLHKKRGAGQGYDELNSSRISIQSYTSRTFVSDTASLSSYNETSSGSDSPKQQNQWEAKIHLFIGQLYLKIPNIDLATKHIQQALSFYKKNGVKNEYSVNIVVEICSILFSNYTLKKDKIKIMNTFNNLTEQSSSNEKFAMHLNRMNRKFMTNCLCYIAKSDLSESERSRLCEVLEQIRQQQNEQFVNSSNKTRYQDLQNVLHKLVSKQQLGEREIQAIEQLDIGEVQIFFVAER